MQHEMSADISFHFGNHFAPGQSKQYSIDCLHQKVESPPQSCKIKRSWFSQFFRFFERDLYQIIYKKWMCEGEVKLSKFGTFNLLGHDTV